LSRPGRVATASSCVSEAADNPTQMPPRHPQHRAMRKFLLAVHLIAALSLVGTDLVLLALGIAGLLGADPLTVYPAASLVAAWLVAPLVVVALATGVLQAVRNGWGLRRYWWVTIKLAVTLAFTVLVVAVLVPRLAASAGAAATTAFDSAARLPLAVVPAAAISAQLVLVGLAITKPPWRMPGQ
jgi:FtsH-binding integral membrane protein